MTIDAYSNVINTSVSATGGGERTDHNKSGWDGDWVDGGCGIEGGSEVEE